MRPEFESWQPLFGICPPKVRNDHNCVCGACDVHLRPLVSRHWHSRGRELWKVGRNVAIHKALTCPSSVHLGHCPFPECYIAQAPGCEVDVWICAAVLPCSLLEVFQSIVVAKLAAAVLVSGAVVVAIA